MIELAEVRYGNTKWKRSAAHPPFINMAKIGRNNKQLRSQIKGEYSELIKNNIGVFQGIPLSDYLFIIYADHVMNEYNNSIK